MFIPADGLYQDLLNNKVGSLKINQRDLVSYAYQKGKYDYPTNEFIPYASGYK